MKASYRNSGINFLPVILCEGKKETICGDALATRKDAIKYAQIEINRRNAKERRNYNTTP